MSRQDHSAAAERILAALRGMANRNGVVMASIPAIAEAAGIPTTRCSQTLGVLRAKRLVERVRDGRGFYRGGTVYRVLA